MKNYLLKNEEEDLFKILKKQTKVISDLLDIIMFYAERERYDGDKTNVYCSYDGPPKARAAISMISRRDVYIV